MKLEEIKQHLQSATKVDDQKVTGIAFDSRNVKPGFVFFAISGSSSNGNDFINDAIQNGAILIVTEQEQTQATAVPTMVVRSVKKALALISHRFFHEPSKKLNLVGVTGTNGKTSVTHMIHYIYEALGTNSGLIGTNSYKVPGAKATTNTTPMSSILNEMLNSSYENQMKDVIMEVSSHGIKENRVDHIDFSTFIFTNLSEDHLDYHKNMDDYMWTKMRPFIALSADKKAIVNLDDPCGPYYCDVTIAQTWTYGLQSTADLSARNIEQSLSGSTFDLYYKGFFACQVKTPYFGIYNVYNALAVLAYFASEGYHPQRIALLFQSLPTIEGRFDTFKTRSGIYVVVDYAHTPDAVENVLKSLSAVAEGNVITVLGAGGDRDKSKRAPMGKAALANSKHVILTSDNPRSEDPHNIIYDMLMGNVRQNYTLCIDREIAIEKALKMAKPNDVVILLGKGHEKTQTIKEKKIRFCDKTIARYHIQKHEL